MTYTETQLSAIDIFGKYIPPALEDGDGTKDIPHLEDLFRVAEEKKYIIRINKPYYEKYILSVVDVSHKGNGNLILKRLYNPALPLLDQPSLPDILNLFK